MENNSRGNYDGLVVGCICMCIANVTWEVLSIPPMSGTLLTPKLALTVKVHTGSTSLLYTWRLLSEDAATQIPSYTDGEGGINCTVTKHSMG
jgi:hypothetical protein